MLPDQEHLTKLTRTHERHLQVLEQQIAHFGPDHAPPHLLTERADPTAELTRLCGEAGTAVPLAGFLHHPSDFSPRFRVKEFLDLIENGYSPPEAARKCLNL